MLEIPGYGENLLKRRRVGKIKLHFKAQKQTLVMNNNFENGNPTFDKLFQRSFGNQTLGR